MTIVLIGPAYPLRGGNALFLAHLYESLSAAHDVHVVSFSRLYPKLLFPGVRQHDISGMALKRHPAEHIIDSVNPLTWIRAARRVVQLNPDLLVFTWWNPFFGPLVGHIAAAFKRRTRRPVLIVAENVISHEGRWIDLFLTKRALGRADAFLALSGVVEKTLKEHYPAVPVFRSTLPVYDCYNTGDALTVSEAKHRLALDGKRVILFFGYVRKYKGLMNLIEALPAVRAALPDAHLLVVGEFYDDPAPYRDTIARLGLTPHATIVNEYVANESVHLYFRAADLVVLPYNEATQSGILSIAFAFDLPAVVTNVGGLAELVHDGQTGFVVPPHDTAALSDAIIRYFREDRTKEFAARVAAARQQNDQAQMREVFGQVEARIVHRPPTPTTRAHA